MRLPVLGSAVGALALTLAAHPVHGAERLTLARVQQLVRQQAPDVLSARTALREAQGARAGATPLFATNPSVSGGAGVVGQPEGWRPREWGVGGAGTLSVQVPVEIAGQRSLRVGAADAVIKAREHAQGDATRRAMLVATDAFARALHAQRLAEVAHASVDLARRFQAAAHGLRDAGLGSALEVDLARLEVEETSQVALSAEINALRLRTELLAYLGLPPDAYDSVDGELAQHAPLPPLEPALRRVAERADIQGLRAERLAALRQANLAHADAFPTPVLGAQYEFQHQAPAPQHVLMAQVTFPLPVFARGQGEEGRARARAAGLADEEEQARRGAEAQVRAAHALLSRIREARDARPAESAEGAELLARLERNYALRVVDLNTVLGVQRRLIQARRASLDLDLQEALARVWLDAAMGGFP
ncbi:MAG: TolC family protein [Deltaproteobacteria bacterium]|nr:TolC family protein [Deltaproteobacteria bacterium]